MNPIIFDRSPYTRRFTLSDNVTELELIVQPTRMGNAYFYEYQGRQIQVAYVTTEGKRWLYAQSDTQQQRGPISPKLAVYIVQTMEMMQSESLDNVYDSRMSKAVPICTVEEALEQLEAQYTRLVGLCACGDDLDGFYGDTNNSILQQLAILVRDIHPGRCPVYVDNCLSGPTTWDEHQIVEHVVSGGIINTSTEFDGAEYTLLVDKVKDIYTRVRKELET